MTVDGPRRVHALDGQSHDLVGVTVNQAGIRKSHTPQKLVRVETDRGYSLECTPQHYLLSAVGEFRRWKTVGNLEIGEEVLLCNSRYLTSERDKSDFEYGWLVGHIKGNGGHNPNKSGGTYARFWRDDATAMIERARRIARALGTRKDFGTGETDGDIVTVKAACFQPLCEIYLGPKDKALKDALIEESSSFVAGFLQGFFDSDGSPQGSLEKGRSVRLSQADRPALEIAQHMLLRLGMASTIYARQRPGLKMMPDGHGGERLYSTQQMWELSVSKDNIEEFGRKIGFSKADKAARLGLLISGMKRAPYRERFSAKISHIEPISADIVYSCETDGQKSYAASGFLSFDPFVPNRRRHSSGVV